MWHAGMFPPTVCMLKIFGTLPILAFQNGRQPIKSILFDLGVCMLPFLALCQFWPFKMAVNPSNPHCLT